MRMLLGAALLALNACTVGTKPQAFQPAITPRGVATTLEISGHREPVAGELIAVTDSALLVLTAAPEPNLTLIHYDRIFGGKFRQLGVRLRDQRRPDPEDREKLRLVSRFPQGMTPELTAAFLATLGRSQVTVPP